MERSGAAERQARIEARVRGAVERLAGRPASALPVRAIAGHASLRTYHRVGDPPDSLVVMAMPPGAGPEEIGSGGPTAPDPFLDVQRWLAAHGVRVPAVHGADLSDPEGGLVVLEDLGDQMLETRLRAGDDPEPLYARAIDQLARLRAAAEADPRGCIAFTRRFDERLYRRELDHFREWLLEAWKGGRLAPAERAELEAAFDGMAHELAALPLGFTHRDYQSRNLMVLRSGELAVIDFQDALLGPRQYDLVALLRDSYVDLQPELVERMLVRYREALAAAGGPRLAESPFRAGFDLLTVQRKLKDAGRFVFIDRVRGNPGFLPSIPLSLRYAAEALERLPGLACLRAILARHVPELERPGGGGSAPDPGPYSAPTPR